MREKINESKKEPLKIQGFTITTLLAYFIIYSIIGFIIETIFGILTKGVLESRKSFINYWTILFNLWFGSCYNDFGSTEI